MAKVRNVSGEPLQVPEIGWRVVAPDEVIDVPDERVEAFTTQESTWRAESAQPSPTNSRRRPAQVDVAVTEQEEA